MPRDCPDEATPAFPQLGRQESPWRERRFITDCLTGLLRSGLSGPAAVPADDTLDWAVLLAEVGRHGVGPLLAFALGARPPGCPEVVWQGLDEQCQRTARRNSFAMVSLTHLLGRMAEANLAPPILLKGASLVHTVYPRLALRPMQDVDLLFAPQQRREIASLLQSEGYQPERLPAPSAWHEAVLVEGQPSLRFASSRGASSLRLECHFALREWPEVTFSELCEHSDPVGASTAPCRAPALPYELLLLLLHLSEHQRSEAGGAGRLLWWFDVAACAQKMASHSDQLSSVMARLAVPRQEQAREILAVVRALFGVAIPLSLAPSPRAGQLRRQSQSLWAIPSTPPPDMRWLTDLFRGSPRLRSPGAKARFVVGYLLPPPAYLRRQYGLSGASALALWYAARPFALTAKLTRALLRR